MVLPVEPPDLPEMISQLWNFQAGQRSMKAKLLVLPLPAAPMVPAENPMQHQIHRRFPSGLLPGCCLLMGLHFFPEVPGVLSSLWNWLVELCLMKVALPGVLPNQCRLS